MEAKTSLISLGNIQLDHLNQPGKALLAFNKYLGTTTKGTLAQEAAWGRIRALGKLGRTADEIDALKVFLINYPSSVQARMARSRLRDLEKLVK